MKKIMFNDKYGLTKAVLEGRKTQTRRIAKRQQMLTILGLPKHADYNMDELAEACAISCTKSRFSPYVVGEEVAVAQSYNTVIQEYFDKGGEFKGSCSIFKSKGLYNKMFVRAELMLHRINITGLRVERLQDISDEDCMKEGIKRKNERYVVENEKGVCFYTNDVILAFRFLIDKTCGKGTWNSNPWVFVYDFEIVK